MARGKAKKLAKQRRQSLAGVMARRKVGVTLAETPWDHGATGPANRRGLIIEQRGDIDPDTGETINPNGITGARRIDLLHYWLKRGSISTAGYNAAVMLKDAFDDTMRSKPSLPDNDRVQSSPKPDHAVAIQIDRISRYQKLARYVAAEDKSLISACVLDGQHPSRVYGALRTREGLAHLREALDRLSDAMSR